MLPTRRGFTLIELLIVVVIIGILAAIAIPKFASTKDRARVATMKADLRNLLSQQEGHYVTYSRYATAVGATESGATLAYAVTEGNTVTLATADPAGGWSATATRADLTATTTCGIYVGSESPPDPAVTNAGQVACW